MRWMIGGSRRGSLRGRLEKTLRANSIELGLVAALLAGAFVFAL